MRSIPVLLSLVLIGACDDDGGESIPDGGGMQPEAEADAGPDAGEPDAGPPLTVRHTWVADSLRMPLSATEAEEYGFDLDGDGVVDNRLGQAYATLASAGSLDVQAIADAAVARGAAIVLFEVQSESAGAALEGRVLEGSSPMPAPCSDANDTVCGRHLDGQGSFEVVTPVPPSAAGIMMGTGVSFGPGQARLPLFLSEAPVWVPIERAQVWAILGAGELMSAKLGGAIPASEVETTIIPALHTDLAATVARDCPAMVCESGSAGETVLQLFDANDDGMVSLVEVQMSTTIQTIFAPDVDTDGDGADDALSAGLGFNAVRATFAAP